MRVNDLVTVHDVSFSMFYAGHGALVPQSGVMLRERQWRILALNLVAPTGPRADKPNDTMLREESFTENILFTRAEFCVSIFREEQE